MQQYASPNPNNTHFDLRFFQVSPSGKIPFPKNDFSAAPDLHWYNYCNGMFSCYLETNRKEVVGGVGIGKHKL